MAQMRRVRLYLTSLSPGLTSCGKKSGFTLVASFAWQIREPLASVERGFPLQGPPICYSTLSFPSRLSSCSVNGMKFLMRVFLWGVRGNF